MDFPHGQYRAAGRRGGYQMDLLMESAFDQGRDNGRKILQRLRSRGEEDIENTHEDDVDDLHVSTIVAMCKKEA